jgi:hypothetical protein
LIEQDIEVVGAVLDDEGPAGVACVGDADGEVAQRTAERVDLVFVRVDEELAMKGRVACGGRRRTRGEVMAPAATASYCPDYTDREQRAGDTDEQRGRRGRRIAVVVIVR